MLTPDQLKALLISTARPLKRATAPEQGAGLLALEAARAARTPTTATQSWPTATGIGSLEAARGSAHITDADGVALTGEQDIFGQTGDGRMSSGRIWTGNAWSSAQWGGDQDPLVPLSEVASP